jgi:dipeptidase D
MKLNYEPKKVFEFFEEICAIPHGSGNLEKISNFLVDFANERGLRVVRDEALNVVIYKEATAGYENSKPVVLQGHMDMVAVKDSDVDKNLETECIEVDSDGEFIFAKGTSLGGDDGIAVAYMLAILDSKDIKHPPIEAVFTTDEEIGMLGANAFDASLLKGRKLLNIDSEDEGVFTVSCAGGATAKCVLPYKMEPVVASVIEIRIEGFRGGHSGVEINIGSANANIIMGRILLNLFQNVGMRLMILNGGEKDNAIPVLSECAIAVHSEQKDNAIKIINDTFEEIKDEYKVTDPNLSVITNAMDEGVADTFTSNATLAAVVMLSNFPNGVQRREPGMEEQVRTSLNLGKIRTETETLEFTFSVRSSKQSEKKYLIEKLKSITEIFGGNVEVSGEYPGWEYRSESVLRDILREEYIKLYGEEPVIEGIHAGLECGIFASKLGDLDAVSIGPQIDDIHTTREKLSIASTERTWKLILNTLERL